MCPAPAERFATTGQVQPAQGAGTGLAGRDAEPELIAVARAEARLRARAGGVRSATGADVSALDRFLGAVAPPPGTHGRDHGPDRSRTAFSHHGARVDAQG